MVVLVALMPHHPNLFTAGRGRVAPGESRKEVWREESSSSDTECKLPAVILNVVLNVDEYL